MIDIRQTPQYARYLKNIGWTVKRIHETNYFIKKFPIIGSVLKLQRPVKIDFEITNILCRKYRVFQVVVEPGLSAVVGTFFEDNHNLLLSQDFKLSNSPYLPTKTLLLDLSLPMNRLISNMENDCRQSIKKSSDLRFKSHDLRNIEEFRNAWTESVSWKRYVPPLSYLVALKKSFKTNSMFFTIQRYTSLYRKKETIAGGIFLIGSRIGYYWQAFTNSEGRKALAQYKIVWEGILWAKKMRAKVFDFEGIYDERFPNKSWLGFTHFKKSFGGYEVSYPGTFVKNLLPFGL